MSTLPEPVAGFDAGQISDLASGEPVADRHLRGLSVAAGHAPTWHRTRPQFNGALFRLWETLALLRLRWFARAGDGFAYAQPYYYADPLHQRI